MHSYLEFHDKRPNDPDYRPNLENVTVIVGRYQLDTFTNKRENKSSADVLLERWPGGNAFKFHLPA